MTSADINVDSVDDADCCLWSFVADVTIHCSAFLSAAEQLPYRREYTFFGTPVESVSNEVPRKNCMLQAPEEIEALIRLPYSGGLLTLWVRSSAICTTRYLAVLQCFPQKVWRLWGHVHTDIGWSIGTNRRLSTLPWIRKRPDPGSMIKFIWEIT